METTKQREMITGSEIERNLRRGLDSGPKAADRPLQPSDTFPRMFGSFMVSKRTGKTATLFMPGSSGRFAGRKYQFRFDGEGFKRQGQFLRADGTIE